MIYVLGITLQNVSMIGLTATDVWQSAYHNSSMLHIGHDNHHMVILPEAVCHSHHILFASTKWRGKKTELIWMLISDGYFQEA